MKRYIGIVEEIDWSTNTCKVRVPNIDGLEDLAIVDPGIAALRQAASKTRDLESADIPYHMQGLRLKDIVYCLDSELEGDNYALLGFFGGVMEDE